MKKILSVVLIAAMVLSVAGCSGNGSGEDIDFDAIGEKIENMSDDELENAIEEGVGKLESMGETTTTAAQTEEAPKEESYEPLQEIIDADLSSGLVQIGDDIFKNGGYMTVNEFVEQYGDKYDVSEINLNGFVKSKEGDLAIIRKKNSSIEFSISYSNATDDRIKIGDAVVYSFSPSGTYQDFTMPNTWFAGGINRADYVPYDDFMAALESKGITEDKYKWKESDVGLDDCIVIKMELSEENLDGVKNPVIEYRSYFDDKGGEFKGMSLNTYRNF